MNNIEKKELLEQHGFDTSKFKLGKICKHGHEWEGSGYGLRYQRGCNSCVTCQGAKRPGAYTRPAEDLSDRLLKKAGIDSKKYYLGSLCKHRHDWEDTGFSLRYTNTKSCLACKKVPVVTDQTFEERFWNGIDIRSNEECWPWLKYKSKHGYGRTTRNGKPFRAHRIAWELFYNQQIPDSLIVRHYICDNPSCCNPHHLRLGTSKDNTMDAMQKNRLLRGEKHGSAKLTNQDVEQMRRLHREKGTKPKDLAGQFGVSAKHAYAVVTYRARKND